MKTRITILATVVATAALIMPTAASANGSGSTNATVTLTAVVRSITVGPANLALNICYRTASDWVSGKASTGATLTLPNGFCLGGGSGVTVTNGPVGGHINVAATNANPTDGGTGSWTLTGSDALSGALPGTDQFTASTVNGTASGGYASSSISTSQACDNAFGGFLGSGCAATAGQSGSENLAVTGPSNSSGSALTYGFTVTWTAVP